ncbi:hotdog fold domain-containing protein [Pseudocolwellia sp. HL-MZ19]|uniref:hotdog fold domain-containing protein n=1 Tax=unclassified Pseudocolwellia TaxID=2848178 RepID=UPI003CEA9398
MSYKPSKSLMLKLWKIFGNFALGRWFVGKALCFTVPYFGTIKPKLIIVKPGHIELTIKKRRAVHNHLKSVHAIAMCNAAELSAGVLIDISLTSDFRWIPIGMTVQYLKIAKTDLRIICKVGDYHWNEAQDVILPVDVYDTNHNKVFHADITMRITPRLTAE